MLYYSPSRSVYDYDQPYGFYGYPSPYSPAPSGHRSKPMHSFHYPAIAKLAREDYLGRLRERQARAYLNRFDDDLYDDDVCDSEYHGRLNSGNWAMQERKREMAQEAQRRREAECERQTQEVLEALYRGDRGRGAERAQAKHAAARRAPSRNHTRYMSFSPMTRSPQPSSHSNDSHSPSPPVQTPSSSQESTLSELSPLVEEQREAGAKIAAFYRRNKALASVRAVHDKFGMLKRAFVRPFILDYEGADKSIISVPALYSLSSLVEDSTLDVEETEEQRPRLAYTPSNAAVHAYAEELVRLLGTLDAVQSWSDQRVRDARREVVRAVETEAGLLDRWWKLVWRKWKQQQSSSEEQIDARLHTSGSSGSSSALVGDGRPDAREMVDVESADVVGAAEDSHLDPVS